MVVRILLKYNVNSHVGIVVGKWALKTNYKREIEKMQK